jgi:hypothetical protein
MVVYDVKGRHGSRSERAASLAPFLFTLQAKAERALTKGGSLRQRAVSDYSIHPRSSNRICNWLAISLAVCSALPSSLLLPVASPPIFMTPLTMSPTGGTLSREGDGGGQRHAPGLRAASSTSLNPAPCSSKPPFALSLNGDRKPREFGICAPTVPRVVAPLWRG